MLGVVGDGGIGCGAVGSAFVVHGEAGEIAVVPGLAAVDGGGEADVAAAPTDAAGPSAHVEGAHNGVAPGKGVRLDFGFVIAVRVGEIVDADSYQRGLGGSG